MFVLTTMMTGIQKFTILKAYFLKPLLYIQKHLYRKSKNRFKLLINNCELTLNDLLENISKYL